MPTAEQAISISPHDVFGATWYFSIGRVHLLQSRTNEAIVWLEKTLSANSEFPTIHAWLASAYALRGEIERAAFQLAEARGLSRDGRYFKHRPVEGGRMFRRAEDPRLAPGHIFRRPAQGRYGGVKSTRVAAYDRHSRNGCF